MKALPEQLDYREAPRIRHWQYIDSEDGTRSMNTRCIRDGNINLAGANWITDDEANGKYAHFHLKEWDIVVSASGTPEGRADVLVVHLPLVSNTSAIRFRSPGWGITSFSNVYSYLDSRDFLDELKMSASGSVQENFGPMHLKQKQMLCPSFDCIEAHQQIAGELLQR